MSNPAGFKFGSVTHYYVPLKVSNATEITVTQSLIFSPSNIHEFGDAVSSFLTAWFCSAILVGRLYLASNGAFLLQTVSSFHERGQLGKEADKACSTTSQNCRIILVGSDLPFSSRENTLNV